jgi:hypothetical protein
MRTDLKTRTPTLQRRYVFARPVAFDLECPDCGTLDVVRAGRGRWSANFNEITHRWMCRGCRRLWMIGLAVWPLRRTGNRQRGPARPLDVRPTDKQLLDLPQLYGVVRQQRYRRGAPVNLVGCPCLDRDDLDPACPFHGENA